MFEGLSGDPEEQRDMVRLVVRGREVGKPVVVEIRDGRAHRIPAGGTAPRHHDGPSPRPLSSRTHPSCRPTLRPGPGRDDERRPPSPNATRIAGPRGPHRQRRRPPGEPHGRPVRTRHHPVEMDISKGGDNERAVPRIVESEGRIDVLINNAGFGLYGTVEDVPLDDARYQFEVNLFGLAHLTQLVLPHMRAQGAGRIVNISSMGGRIFTPFGAWYHATKHALEGWSDCLRIEAAPFNIQVVLIQPGGIRTGHRSRRACAGVRRGRDRRQPATTLREGDLRPAPYPGKCQV